MDVDVLTNCFPRRYREDAQEIYAKLDLHSKHELFLSFQVVIEGENLVIPQRIYSDEKQLEKIDSLSRTRQEIVLCFYSRHHDGFVREYCLKEILGSQKVFVIPFVLQLLGEYVIEIIEYIYQNKEFLNKPAFKTFIAENSDFYNKTCARIISYWNCYYRNDYPNYTMRLKPKHPTFNDYPGIKMKHYIDKEILAECP